METLSIDTLSDLINDLGDIGVHDVGYVTIKYTVYKSFTGVDRSKDSDHIEASYNVMYDHTDDDCADAIIHNFIRGARLIDRIEGSDKESDELEKALMLSRNSLMPITPLKNSSSIYYSSIDNHIHLNLMERFGHIIFKHEMERYDRKHIEIRWVGGIYVYDYSGKRISYHQMGRKIPYRVIEIPGGNDLSKFKTEKKWV